MICFQYADELDYNQRLKSSMFRDRATQFSKRLGWSVVVDEYGEEHDEYDTLNPLYVIAVNPDGSHAGSMRFLPTTGKTMVNDHFLDLTNGVEIRSPLIWECTRFCISHATGRSTAAKLMAAGGKLMREYCLKHFVGVFDAKMERVYRSIGAEPTVLGRSTTGKESVGVGLWEFTNATYHSLLERSGLTDLEMELFFLNSRHAVPDLAIAS